MSINLNNAFRERGLNAKYEGAAARILPITPAILADYAATDGKNVGKDLVAGDVVVSWQDAETGKRKGDVLDLLGNNDLSIMIRLSDGTDTEVRATNIDQAITSLAKMVVSDRVNRAELPAKNEAAARKHDLAVERGEAEGAFKPELPKYADGAFANIEVLNDSVKARLSAEYRNDFTGASGKSIAAIAELNVSNALRDNLTHDERAKITEKRKLNDEIRGIKENRAAAAKPEFDREAAADRMEAAKENLNINGDAPSQGQMAAMMPNAELAKLAFLALTTTSVHEIHATRLGPRDANAVQQDLRRYEDTAYGKEAIDNTRALLTDKMPGYTFNAKLYSRDGVDILMVADQAGPVVYMWDSQTRVTDFDREPHLSRMTLDEVPTDEELQTLRDTLRDLRYDNGGDIDFGFGDDDEVIDGPGA